MKYLGFAVVAAFLLTAAGSAFATDCPAGTPSCKIITITPDEERALTEGIFPAAEWANRAGLTDMIAAWKQKIRMSPNGVVHVEVSKEPKK